MNSRVLIASMSLTVGALGSIGGSTAHAGRITTSAIACQPLNNTTYQQLQYNPQGVSSYSSTTATPSVSCPIARDGVATTVTIAGRINAGITMDCSLYVQSSTGTFLTGRNFSLTSAAPSVSLGLAGVVTETDVLAVFCTLPSAASAALVSFSTF